MKHSLGLCGVLVCYLLPAAIGQQLAGIGAQAPAKGPVQVAAVQGAPVTGARNATANSDQGGQDARRDLHLDVVVTDKAGKPTPGLSAADFALLDNDQPRKIVSFEAHAPGAEGAPTQIIILFDTVNVPFDSVSYARQQVGNFLEQNGGHLTHPVALYFLTDTKVVGQEKPTTDGEGLAAHLEATEGRVRAENRVYGDFGRIERFQYSLKMISAIVERLQTEPGRKLLIWVGPGWPMLDEPGLDFSTQQQQKLFANIVGFSTLMRQARVDLYSISLGSPDRGTYLYESYVKGVKKVTQAQAPNLGLKVLAVQSGGLALAPSNNLAAAIDTCIQDAGTYYSLSFEPPPAGGPNEYHDLKVRVDQPGLTARTNTGYYAQPDNAQTP
jgi:VWFA-related protein